MLTTFILITLTVIKFTEGGWITILVTGLLVGAAFLIKRHYNQTKLDLQRLEELVEVVDMGGGKQRAEAMGLTARAVPPVEPRAKTAVMLVNGFNGLGLHTLFGVQRMFPGVFKNFVFVQIGVVDAGNFKGADEVENLKRHIEEGNQRYINYMAEHGLHAEAVSAVAIDVVQKAAEIAPQVLERFPNAIFFGGQLVFRNDTLLHPPAAQLRGFLTAATLLPARSPAAHPTNTCLRWMYGTRPRFTLLRTGMSARRERHTPSGIRGGDRQQHGRALASTAVGQKAACSPFARMLYPLC